MEFLAQVLGIVVAALCIIAMQVKKKWQMMLFSAIANALAAINYLLFVGFSAAFFVSTVAVVQTTIDMFKSLKGKETKLLEKIIYLALYLTFSIIGIKSPFDWFIVLAALTFCLAVFCKKEQSVRWFMLANAGTNITYNLLMHSTNLYSQIISFVSIIIALIRYKKGSGLNDKQ